MTGLTALAILGLYKGVDAHRNYTLQQINREFPAYVEKFEDKYGVSFQNKPKLKFEPLSIDISGKNRGDTVVINDSLLAHILNYFEGGGWTSAAYHELAHIFVNDTVKKLNLKWRIWINGKPYLTKEISETLDVVHEGTAEFITKQLGGTGTEDYRHHYDFVKPVLDRFGVHSGIEKLFLEPPTKDEVKVPERYYKKLGLEHKL